MRGLSIEEVAAATRISTRFVEAIENEKWESLPGGVFNRGFIRSIARYLGLDEDSMVAEYALETRGKMDAGAAAEPATQIPRNWKPAVVAAVVLIALIAGVTFVSVHYGGRIANFLRGKGSVAAAPANASPLGDASRTAKNPASAPETTSGGASVAQSPSAIPGAAALAAADPLRLKIQAARTLKVTILADGKPVFDGAIEIGQARQFEAQNVFAVTASEPSAAIFELNGQPVSGFGEPGLPGSITLTRSDLKPAAGDPH